MLRARSRISCGIALVCGTAGILAGTLLPATASALRPPAPRATAPAVYAVGQLVDNQTGRCLDSNASGTVSAYGCDDGTDQNWGLTRQDQLEDMRTGLCLDGPNGLNVRTKPCNSAPNQQWGFAVGQSYRHWATKLWNTHGLVINSRYDSECLTATARVRRSNRRVTAGTTRTGTGRVDSPRLSTPQKGRRRLALSVGTRRPGLTASHRSARRPGATIPPMTAPPSVQCAEGGRVAAQPATSGRQRSRAARIPGSSGSRAPRRTITAILDRPGCTTPSGRYLAPPLHPQAVSRGTC